jgi:pyruvate/2-oxoglutarate dehydrogenase complex dihydrolipoamide acyltransferase (E2) component
MKLSEKKNSNFTPHPETEGPIKGVIVDVTEPKKRLTQYGEKDEFRLVFETEAEDEENDRRFCVWSRGYTPSLNEKAAVRKDLKKILGRELTAAELLEFDLETLIGYPVKLIIQHEHKDDRVFANISFIAPDKSADPLKPSGKFVRQRDRDTGDAPAKAPATAPAPAPKAPAAPAAAAAPAAPAAAASYEDVVIHVGKYKGKRLGSIDEEGAKALIERWLPTAIAAGNAADAKLIEALTELDGLLKDEVF